MTRLYLLLAFIFFLAGCGQSGPLYIPGDPSEVRDPPPAAETESDEEDEKPDNGG